MMKNKRTALWLVLIAVMAVTECTKTKANEQHDDKSDLQDESDVQYGTGQYVDKNDVQHDTEQYDDESDFAIERGGNEIIITEYRGSKTEVRIPPRIQNLPVTFIGNFAFEDCASLTSVTIPDSVTWIANNAFAKCTSLANITIPGSVESIEDYAFYRCTSLTSVTILNSVKSIGDAAFSVCTKLTSVTFQSTIPSSGFSNNTDMSPFPGDLRDKFYATDKTNGTPGTYTRPDGESDTWTKK